MKQEADATGRRQDRIVLRTHPGVLCGTDGELFLRLDGELHTLHGPRAKDLVAHILQLVDGRSTEDEIVAGACRQGVSAEWAARAVQWLVQEGLCVRDRCLEVERSLLVAYEPQIRYFTAHASMPTDVQNRLRDSRVTVIGLEYLGSMLVQQLAQSGVGQVRGIGPSSLAPAETLLFGAAAEDDRHQALSRWIRGQGLVAGYHGVPVEALAPLDWRAILADCDLAVLVAPRMSVPMLTMFNRAALHANVSFLSVVLDGAGAAIGPLVIPEETACLTCRELRRPRRETDEEFRRLQETQAEAVGLAWRAEAFLFAHVSVLAALTVAEIVVALSRCREPAILGRELLVDTHSWRIQLAPVLKVPRCWDCGRPRRVPPSRPFAFGGPPGDRYAAAR
ncbi:MAG: TOMM precursor leader peptide-binding protein [Candidatus Rokuibacteriota bacterium]